jgi:hypothetical protein
MGAAFGPCAGLRRFRSLTGLAARRAAKGDLLPMVRAPVGAGAVVG